MLVNSELKKKRKLTANSSSNAENSSSDPNKAEKKRKINTNLLDKIADVIAKFDNKFGVADSDIEALTHFNDKLKPDLMEALHVFTHQKNVIFEPSAYKSLKKGLRIIFNQMKMPFFRFISYEFFLIIYFKAPNLIFFITPPLNAPTPPSLDSDPCRRHYQQYPVSTISRVVDAAPSSATFPFSPHKPYNSP